MKYLPLVCSCKPCSIHNNHLCFNVTVSKQYSVCDDVVEQQTKADLGKCLEDVTIADWRL